MHALFSAGLTAAAVALLNVAASGEVLYHLKSLGIPGPGYGSGSIRAINELGQACGYVLTSRGTTTPFFWDPVGGMVDLGDLPGGHDIDPLAEAINNQGHVAGYGISERGGEAFFWTPEAGLLGLGPIPGGDFSSRAYGINDLDQVVGLSDSVNSNYEAFLWDPKSGMIGLGDLPGGQFFSEAWDINNAGQVVGTSISDFFLQAFIWDAENGMRAIEPAPDGSVPHIGYANNELGQVTGAAAVPPSWRNQPYLWDPEEGLTIVRFGPGGSHGEAHGINDLGQIVGWGGDSALEQEAFIWDAEGGLRRLNDLIDTVSRQRFGFIGSAFSINNRGQIGVLISGPAALLTPFVPGDMNWDGVVDAGDIEGFLLALFDRPGYDQRFGGPFKGVWAGDMNQDGTVDALDIEPFIEVLFP